MGKLLVRKNSVLETKEMKILVRNWKQISRLGKVQDDTASTIFFAISLVIFAHVVFFLFLLSR